MSKSAHHKQEWDDEYTLLCEKCGYVIEGLDTEDPCPECGKPIKESLPERRVGTPWQQNPGFKSLMQTWWMTLRHPIQTLNVMQFQTIHHPSIIIKPFLMIALFFVILGSMIIVFFAGEAFFLGFVAFLLFMGIASIGCFVTIGLMKIESSGLRIISKQNKFRITNDISNNIVVHGSVGRVMVFIGLGVFSNTYVIWILFKNSEFINSVQIAKSIFVTGTGFLAISSILGFLFFEFFAYLGLRRCKFANRVRPSEHRNG